ncbi:GlxA family transcriptional regulator [Acetobacter sp.]|jgi:transcriptional regulator GlxA family with amidase domain|uniref:GlxA family transcriptional regulator n=1 Tax=Acetobacter sp. TaxID=440 RepID=UPI0025C2ED9D|nr:GlxA family transcriptional regulator [Acetobacter sp.]MCH4090995.1 GlxA family transcriptional regulator [Acetobacter sp.]MCI1300178.1 GlxA family transcriptional regulator [Acetobacter sp.]MCI1316154.1 GlxA family transcriptional regulator [Acetobacter sp.]
MPAAPDLSNFQHFAFLTLSGYSMIAVSNAIEALRMANRLAGEDVYTWSVLSLDGESVLSSNGLSLSPTQSAKTSTSFDVVFVCGGVDVRAATSPALLTWLRQKARQGVPLGALCTGTFALAEAGLLRGYRCAVHWENLSSIREEFPEIDIVDDFFVIDRNRLTCTGGLAPLDMMLKIIASRYGTSRVNEISTQFLLERGRSGDERQPVPVPPGTPEAMARALSLIERESDRPLRIEEIAGAAHLSVRQLERVFRRHAGVTPAAYLVGVRLERARRLLRQTTMSVTDIGTACGFVSSSHFSSAYRSRFGCPPRDERRRKNGALQQTSIMDVPA